ncbi:putative membrane protein [Synechococcus sp. RS9907]|nr:putative membrane protein [Synechococcus sp. RS9907]
MSLLLLLTRLNAALLPTTFFIFSFFAKIKNIFIYKKTISIT